MNEDVPTIAVLGASGLIGSAIVADLHQRGVPVVGVARRFSAAQKNELGEKAVECPVVGFDVDALSSLVAGHNIDVVVNCIGVLQEVNAGKTDDVHSGFVGRIVEALTARAEPMLLIHLSIPGREEDDQTQFSRSKRQSDSLIMGSSVSFVILRPGFVIAPGAYGGSALVRSLAAMPLASPLKLAGRPFVSTAIGDITRTIGAVVDRWRGGDRRWSAVWDVMAHRTTTFDEVVEAVRHRFGGPRAAVRLPDWLLKIGTKLGDLSAYLGWRPPIRSTALREIERGVDGDPEAWTSETGLKPASLDEALKCLPLTVQEAWFARLYLIKALAIVSLVVFWLVSGLIALTVAFDAAVAILTSRGFASGFAKTITLVSSAADIAVGLLIAFKKTCRFGLIVGLGVSAFYLIGSAFITPDLWIEPLGALVKTLPAMVLMLVALAMSKDRGG